eukprot:1742024-Prymnesium_polylepis.1
MLAMPTAREGRVGICASRRRTSQPASVDFCRRARASSRRTSVTPTWINVGGMPANTVGGANSGLTSGLAGFTSTRYARAMPSMRLRCITKSFFSLATYELPAHVMSSHGDAITTAPGSGRLVSVRRVIIPIASAAPDDSANKPTDDGAPRPPSRSAASPCDSIMVPPLTPCVASS